MSASPSERDIARELRLRAAPAPVVRLSRKVLVGLGAVSSLAVLGAVAWSLAEKPHGKGQSEVYQTGEQRPPDAMAALPADYASPGAAGAPKLGPPLPGDLGPPMLAAGQTSTSPISGAGGSSASSSAQQRAEDLQAARASRLFSIDGRAAGGETGEVAEPSLPIPAQPPQAVIPGLRSAEHVEATLPVTISGQQSTSADRIEAPISPYVLQAGSVIPAALLTGLRSDLAGEIAAQVTENVFDSPTGR
ncbi:MAG: TrbI/VirB10 family protein, partial [Caulobacteraceae bacterium]